MCVHDLVDARVLRTPAATALRQGGEALDYGELGARANRLARHLAGRGARRGDVVCVLLERTPDLVVAALAVLKTGAAYALVDPELPAARVRAIVRDTAARLVVTAGAFAALLDEAESGSARTPRVTLDAAGQAEAIARSEPIAPRSGAGPDDAACVMFTSGSTGRPKGVLATHRAIVRAITSSQYCDIGREDVVLQASQISWDVFAQELWGALANGATCVLQEGQRPDPERIEEAVARHGVTVMYAAAGLFNYLLDEHPAVFSGLRKVMTGGEPLSPEHVRRALTAHPRLRLVNGYGPVETMILSTFRPVTAADSQSTSIPIGTAFDGDTVRLLDEELRPVADGGIGELYIGGDGLAHGYLAQPARTGERFVADPFAEVPGARMYRTGDLARRLADGAFEFLGRVDEQVKIRGMRIEPGEIEAVLAAHPSVADCAVVAREIVAGSIGLVAYVVLEDGVGQRELREHCRRLLPDHLVPQVFVPLPDLPLSATGKLDRTALPAPAQRTPQPSRAPETELEQVICDAFAAVLGRAEVGAEDGFFELGGHSLTATRLAARLRAQLERDVSLRTIFEAPTPASLAALLEQGTAMDALPSARPPLVRRQRPTRLPLGAAQRRLWFINESERGAAYNLPVLIRVAGPLNLCALRLAVRDVVARHESLRTLFPAIDGEPYQRILSAGAELEVLTVSASDLEDVIAEHARKPFALRIEPPLRTVAFTTGSDQHAILLVLHHIAGDGWSLRPLLDDLGTAYRARLEGDSPDLPELPVQYTDYALWHREALDDDTQLKYWIEQLEGLPAELPLPTDRRRTAAGADSASGPSAEVVTVELSASLHAQIVTAARASGCTLFAFLHAALTALYTRLGAGTDIPVGTVTAGRPDPAVDDVVGFFVNTLTLRTDASGDPRFGELVRRSRDVELDAFAHQDVRFDKVVGAINPDRIAGRHPLFQSIIVLQNNLRARIELPGAEAVVSTPKTGVPKADLVFEFTESFGASFGASFSADSGADSGADAAPGGLSLELEYTTALYDASTARFLAEALVRVLAAGSENAELSISALPVISAEQREQLLRGWNANNGGDVTVLDMFRQHVQQGPERDAVVCGSVRLSYAELDAQSDELARRLRVAGAGRETVVAVCLPRRAEIALSFLGIMKAGAAYLPLDPENPPARNRLALEDADARLIVAVGETAEQAAALGLPVVPLDAAGRPEGGGEPAQAEVTGADAAYLIFTSGSTGRPKGVVIEHHALANLARAIHARFAPTPQDRVLQWSSFTFDMSVWDMTMALTTGAALHVVRPHERVGAELEAMLERSGVTIGMLAPAALATLPGGASSPLPRLHTLFAGGEGFGPSLVERWARGRRFVNAYGPTEAAVAVTTADLLPGDPVVVGTALPGVGVYVLDDRLEPALPGVVGEVYAAGPSLARGYAGRAARTAERFVADPHGAPGTRMYRTGDLGRFRADGRLEVVGRVDGQVKLRGFRIELGEIEAVLAAHHAVGHAASAVHRTPGSARLVAYVTATREAVSDHELRAWAAARLPAYMVPSVFVRLDALPTNAAGKLARAELPPPPEPDVLADDAYTAPRTSTELALCRIWAAELAVERVGAGDDYFRLGGDSLAAVRLAARIQRETGRPLGAAQILLTPTVRALAEHLDALPAAAAVRAAIPRQPRSPRSARRPNRQ